MASMTAARHGTLVGISSVAGVRGLPGSGAYSMSKAAATRYLESLRVEMRPRGVAVVTIAPGYVRSEMTAHNPHPMLFLMDTGRFALKGGRPLSAGSAKRPSHGRCVSQACCCMRCRAGSTTCSSKRRHAASRRGMTDSASKTEAQKNRLRVNAAGFSHLKTYFRARSEHQNAT